MSSDTSLDPDPVALSAGQAVRRRRRLPDGRAVLGGFLVALAVLGVVATTTGADDEPSTSWLVVEVAVAGGEPIPPDALTLVAADLPAQVAGGAFSDPARLEGAIARHRLEPGDLVRTGDVALADQLDRAAPEPVHIVSFPVPAERVPHRLEPGDRIALVATYGTGADATSQVAFDHVAVLTVDTADTGLGSSGTVIVTVALDDPVQVVETAHVAQSAELTVVETTHGGDLRLPDGRTTDRTPDADEAQP